MSSKCININNSEDPSYRYKIDKILLNKGGKGNGCYTIFCNLNNVSKQIGHNPVTICKYIGINLGAKVIIDKTYSIQGHYDTKKVQNIIFNYINSFVLCPTCCVPELNYTFDKINKIIKLHCIGCGEDNIIDDTTMNKNNKKIFNKIINDIENNYFDKSNNTSHLENKDQDSLWSDTMKDSKESSRYEKITKDDLLEECDDFF